MNQSLPYSRPLSIAHRGASAYAPANSIQAFLFAAQLGADMWEVDLRLSADKQILAFHDDNLPDGRKIGELSYAEIQKAVPIDTPPLFKDILNLAQQHKCGIYADIKDREAAIPISNMLTEQKIELAILGSFDQATITLLIEHETPYPLAGLIPVGADPFSFPLDIDVIHLCWERLDRPQDLLDEAFFARCRKEGRKVVLWHEEGPARMSELRGLPVFGICSDQPELVHPFVPPEDWPVQIVCHRGANHIAPENTLKGAVACFAAGFSHVELDVQVTADNKLVAMHDSSLERTSNGTGPVCEKTLKELGNLSAGAWFSDHYADEKIPTLEAYLRLAKSWGRQLYVELKNAPAELVWQSVVSNEMVDSCFFWSFNHDLLVDMRAIAPTAHIMLRRQDFDTLNETLESLSPALVEYTVNDELHDIETLRDKNVLSMLAYNGKDLEVFQSIVALKPDLVNLGYPFEFAAFISDKRE
ncbi:glycerophosphodiester phosphodiesterase family protein [Granulosicoccus antarcticus]|uniref:Glycerophosphoryl diester phosphodiesterase n=1 Tax=Granulosicoccus antarcticus IMCC3135 TaxID=1192854 RepID=A0A2Z2NPM1_9GAMM|nr:glycerophosphodiester phosphodiesterase family protein [Granulosicoccus antarcticus]ASJ73396.1 Glycerophosphoryl diester phosphodiesterase [Granulosicoccus antarcticus IMCC3135]